MLKSMAGKRIKTLRDKGDQDDIIKVTTLSSNVSSDAGAKVKENNYEYSDCESKESD